MEYVGIDNGTYFTLIWVCGDQSARIGDFDNMWDLEFHVHFTGATNFRWARPEELV